MALTSPVAATAQAWRSLPRERRDTLFLLGVLGWTVLPHLQHVPAWIVAFAITLLLWRATIALRGAKLPSRWVVTAAMIVAGTAVALTQRTLWGRDAGVALLVLLMALKTLELSARRDAMVVFFLGFFLVLTNFLFSQSLGVAMAMLVSVWGLLTALTLAHMPNGQPTLREAGTLAARAALLGLPVMVVLFLLFPRIGPLWGMQGNSIGHTGLSDSLQMGSMAEIANDDSVAMRLRFDGGKVPQAAQLYFRGPVLSRFDGQRWLPPDDKAARPFTRAAGDTAPGPASNPGTAMRLIGPSIGYEMTLEPLNLNILPLLETTPALAGAAPVIPGVGMRLDDALQWRTTRVISARQRFNARAWLRFEHGPLESELALREDVELPPGFNPRSLQWAAQMRRDPRYANATADTLAEALIEHIRKEGFRYTLSPGLYGVNAVDEFWFDRHEGFCEHFAASFVVMLRALDVPARIVTGFQGADPLPVDGYTIVRQSNAHAWAEYWMRGRGWVRIDPTAAVAPDRVLLGLALPPPKGFVSDAISGFSPDLLRSVRDAVDAMNNRWNQWVLDYSRERQFQLLEALGVKSPGWEDLLYALIAVVSGGSLAGAIWAWLDRRRQDPSQRLRARLKTALARIGIVVADHDTPGALAERVRQQHGHAGQALAAALLTLEQLRYARAERDAKPSQAMPDRVWWRTLHAAVAGLRQARTG